LNGKEPINGGNSIHHLKEVKELFLQSPKNPILAEQLLAERDLKLPSIRSAIISGRTIDE
jgi:hypothetical protein